MQYPRAILYLITCITALGIVWVMIGHYTSVPSVVPATAPLQVQETYWMERVTAVGGTRAYQELQEFASTLSPSIQHQEAHVFGGALYKAEGASGLTVCDSQYSFGCFHEFLGQAIAALGLTAADSLAEDCVRSLGPARGISCQHGIGHGIQASIGYGFKDLKKTLALCEGFSRIDPIGGCYAGAFMEYNLQTMLGTEARLRAADNSDTDFPCDVIANQYKKACYFSQPQWWRQRAKEDGIADTVAAYAHVGELCSRVPDRYIRTCFEGIGAVVSADADFVGARARALCEGTTHVAADQLYCKSFAANALFGTKEEQKREALAVCADLSGSAHDYCSAYAQNKANILIPIDLP